LEGGEDDVVGFVAVVGGELEAVAVRVVEKEVDGTFAEDSGEDGRGE